MQSTRSGATDIAEEAESMHALNNLDSRNTSAYETALPYLKHRFDSQRVIMLSRCDHNVHGTVPLQLLDLATHCLPIEPRHTYYWW